MRKFEMTSLARLCNLNMGQSPASESYNTKQDGLPFYQGNADFGNIHPHARIWCNNPNKIAEANDILLSVRAPIGALNIAKERCCIGRGLAALTPIQEKCSLMYLYYALKNSVYILEHQGTGSTFKAVGKSAIEALEIPTYPLDEQRHIALILTCVDVIIENVKKQLAKFDTLVKSRFIEMFGDPVTNPMGWEVKTVGENASDIKYGTSAKASDNGKYKYLRMNNLTYDGYLDLSDLKYIDVSDEELEKYVVRKGDVLFNRTNSTELVGKTALFDFDEDMIIAGYIIRVRLNEAVSPVFFTRFMNLEHMKTQLQAMAKGAVNQANINAQEMKEIEIYLPPIALQNQFADFVQQVDKSKSVLQKLLEKQELLRAALMQEYFG